MIFSLTIWLLLASLLYRLLVIPNAIDVFKVNKHSINKIKMKHSFLFFFVLLLVLKKFRQNSCQQYDLAPFFMVSGINIGMKSKTKRKNNLFTNQWFEIKRCQGAIWYCYLIFYRYQNIFSFNRFTMETIENQGTRKRKKKEIFFYF